MDAPLLESFRMLLLEKKQQILDSHDMTKDDTKPVVLDQSSVGRLSRIDAIQIQEMAQQSARRKQDLLVSIDKALWRIDQDLYGVCEHCDEDINPKRLQIDPTLTLCVTCAGLLKH